MAASPRPPSWGIENTEFNAGVLGETALPGYWVVWFGSADQGRSALPGDGFAYSTQAFAGSTGIKGWSDRVGFGGGAGQREGRS